MKIMQYYLLHTTNRLNIHYIYSFKCSNYEKPSYYKLLQLLQFFKRRLEPMKATTKKANKLLHQTMSIRTGFSGFVVM